MTKISNLPPISEIQGTDYIPIYDAEGQQTGRISYADLFNNSEILNIAAYSLLVDNEFDAPVKLAQGGLLNGRLNVSVSSNNITVSIRDLNNQTPTDASPVYVRIGNNIRKINSSLSVTKNAGTNWFGSGGAMFAALEQDYFVYLGYNSTDGITIGFARIPWANSYNDFSTTSTDDTYAAISTIANAAATDEYVNVGRFGALLSASASYNWSVPTFTPRNLIQRPIFNTRRLSYNPTLSGRFDDTKWTKNCRYIQIGKTVHFYFDVTANAATPMSGGSGEATFTLPVTSTTLTQALFTARILDPGVSAYFGLVEWASTTTASIRLVNVGGTYPIFTSINSTTPMTWASTDQITVTGTYEAA